MGVVVEDIRFNNDFTGTTTDYLIGNVGDKITIEVDFRAEEVFVTENEAEVDRILLAPQNFRVNTTDTNDIIYCEDTNALANFKIGDKVGIFTATSQNPISGVYNYYICYEKINDQAIRVTDLGGNPVDFYASNSNNYDIERATNSSVFIDTDLTSINYRWNFVPNLDSGGFENQIDAQINEAKAGGLVLSTPVDMIFSDPVTNNYGSVTVEKLAGTATAQKYTLTHETIITPFFLAGQELDLADGIPPNYLDSNESLKYIVSLDVGRNVSDPNYIETVDFTANKGNVGWFNENYNGNKSNYSVSNVAYKRLDLSAIESIELTDNTQTLEIDVTDNKGVPNFLSGSTEFTLNFCILPDNEVDYTYNGKNVIQNFFFDTAKNVADGSTSVDGDNLATDNQVFTNVVGTVNSASSLTISATIDFNTNGLADLLAGGFDYFLWVSVADHTQDIEESDRVSLVTDIQPFYIDVTDDGLIDFEDKFLRHYEGDIEIDGTTSPIVRIEDDVLVRSRFSIDRLGRETDDILINSVGVSLIAKKIDGTEFTLENFNTSLSGTQVVGDSQYIDFSSERSFQMPDGDIRKTISVKRRSDLDTNDLRYYDIVYPFLMRWEYWLPLVGSSSDVFDLNEPNNGQNKDWQRYDSVADWDIYYRTEVNVVKNGNLLAYRNDTKLETYDYTEDVDWSEETIVALNADTLAPQGTLLVSPTRIKASKTYNGSSLPTVNDVNWVLRIEVYQQGGISDIRFLSSVYDWTENSWFKSIDGSNKVVKSVVGNVHSAEALVDFSALPANSTFKISARIYNEEALPPFCCLVTEDGQDILLESTGDCLGLEACEIPVSPDVPYESDSCNFTADYWDSIKATGGNLNYIERIYNLTPILNGFVGYPSSEESNIEYTHKIIARGGQFSDKTLTGGLMEITLTGGAYQLGGTTTDPVENDAIPLDEMHNVGVAGTYLVVDCFINDPYCGIEYRVRIGYGDVPAEYLVNGNKRGVVHKIEWQP